MKKLTKDEALCELFKISYNYLNESTNLSIKFYENQYKMYEGLICNHLEEEPLKFLRLNTISGKKN